MKKKILAGLLVLIILLCGGILFLMRYIEPEQEPYGGYEVSGQDRENFDDLERIRREMNEAAAAYTNEEGYVEPEDFEAAFAAVGAYGEDAQAQGKIRSSVEEDSSVLVTLNSGYVLFYTPRVRGMQAGSGRTVVYTMEPYSTDLEFVFNAILGGKESLSAYGEALFENEDIAESCWSAEPKRDGQVTVEAAKEFEPDSCVFWNSHGGYNTQVGPVILTGEESSLENTGYYAKDLIGRRLLVGTDGKFALTSAFFEYYYEDGDLEDSMFYLAACATLQDDGLAKTLMKKGADLVAGSSQSISIFYSTQIVSEVMERMGESEGGKATDFQTALQGAKDKYGQKDTIWGVLPYSDAEVIYCGDGTYSLTDGPREFDPFSQASPDILGKNVLDTYLEPAGREGDFAYGLLDGKAVLLDYTGTASSLTLPETIAGYQVAAVGQKCFMGNETLEEVVIPNSLKAVHPYAFYECANLRKVTLGYGLSYVDRFAFAGSTLSLLRVYRGTAGEAYAEQMGYSDQVTRLEYLELSLSGDMLRLGDTLYYVKYNGGSFEPMGQLGWYAPVPGAENALVRRDSTGEEQVLYTGQIGGRLALAGNRIYFEIPVSSTGQDTLGSCGLDGEDVRTNLGAGSILACDGEAVFCTGSSSEQIDRIEGASGNRSRLVEKGIFLTLRDGQIYYQPVEEDEAAASRGQVSLGVIGADGQDGKILCTTAADLYEESLQGTAYIAKMVFYGDGILFSYGSSAGSGMVFQGGKLCYLDPASGSLQTVAGDEGLVNPDFYVDEEGQVIYRSYDGSGILFEPMQKYGIQDGSLYWFSEENGEGEEVLSQEDYRFLETGLCGVYGETCLDVRAAEKTGDTLYVWMDYGVMDASSSVGWRTGYRRQESALLEKDLRSGQVSVLYTY